MTQLLVISAVVAIAFLQFAQAQLPIPLPDLPIPLPAIPLPGLPLLPAVIICPAGYFGLAALCFPCPAGTSSLPGSLACNACPAGSYAPGPGSNTCTFCSEGTYPSPAKDTCLCGKGSKGKGASKGKAKGVGAAPLLGLNGLPLVGGLTGGLPVVGGGTGGLLNGLPVVGGTPGVGAVGGVGGVTVTIGGVTVTGPLPIPAAPVSTKGGKSKGKGKQ